MLYSILASFISLKSGLEGPQGKEGGGNESSSPFSSKATGQGLPGVAEEGNLEKFGDIGCRPWVLIPGSPEHNLLVEARGVTPGGSCRPGRDEAGLRQDGSPVRIGKRTTEGKVERYRTDPDLG